MRLFSASLRRGVLTNETLEVTIAPSTKQKFARTSKNADHRKHADYRVISKRSKI